MPDIGQVELEGDLLHVLNRAKSGYYNDKHGEQGKKRFKIVLQYLTNRLGEGNYDNVVEKKKS